MSSTIHTAIRRLIEDGSIAGSIHYSDGLFGDCEAYAQVTDDSMSPGYQPDTYLFCNHVSVDMLEPGRSYLFGVKIGGRYRHVFKQFDCLQDGAIQVSAINPTYNPCEPIPLIECNEVFAVRWRLVRETDEQRD